MSQHIFKDAQHEVILGYDRPLDYVFCTVWNADHAVVYSNLEDLGAGTEQQDVNYFRPVLARLGITVPEEMFAGVAEDQRQRAGNKIVRYPRGKESGHA